MKLTSGLIVLSPDKIARWPEGWMVTGILLEVSVTKMTREVSTPTPEMRPTSPRPSIAGQPSGMPSR